MLRGLERFTSFRFNPICPNSALAARYFFDNGGFTWYFSALSSNRSLVGFFDAQSPFLSNGFSGRVWALSFFDLASPATGLHSSFFDEIPKPFQVSFDSARRNTQCISSLREKAFWLIFHRSGDPGPVEIQ